MTELDVDFLVAGFFFNTIEQSLVAVQAEEVVCSPGSLEVYVVFDAAGNQEGEGT